MLYFMDGFDYYASADIGKKWSGLGISDQAQPLTIVSGGRFGIGSNLQFGAASVGHLYKVLPNYGSLVVGFAFKWSTTTAITGCGPFFMIQNSGNRPGMQLIHSNGLLTYVGASGFNAVLSTTLVPGVWYYIEVKHVPTASSTTGQQQVRINGTLAYDLPAGHHTSDNDPVFNCAILRFGNFGNNFSAGLVYSIDDVYVCDQTGSTNNNFLGDSRIESLVPSAAGSSTQWTPDSGSNYARVNEGAQDGDTSYVKTNVVTDLDLYTMADLTSVPVSVHAVQVNTFARKDDIGPRLIASAIKSGGTVYDHGATNPFGLADGYTEQSDVWELDPNGNIPWTGASINAMEAGVKLVG